ncbi:hypothetical protein EVAR_52233_1 [Eumeta japonica]|uniref:Uncharacterized protein n=1 Tax=Eumeta variegata TaxID=151549 RepID=A0A4C1Z535_EUMVA|nr:hypothetical protein EVAR_52233_1 [Eumeta japonica]
MLSQRADELFQTLAAEIEKRSRAVPRIVRGLNITGYGSLQIDGDNAGLREAQRPAWGAPSRRASYPVGFDRKVGAPLPPLRSPPPFRAETMPYLKLKIKRAAPRPAAPLFASLT